ncbi:glycosyltransferase family 4 protein [Geoalkalibacter halelectricus]|uniref:Glycosyltransferase family 4 protein n=1 Tax=Geoalkalibacter halelectricus TaxID=2847045 RepID=A0ABY5ZKC4_9BACT|nr:glycosyltransferase family 4 protein [Geoalkalibacter halelectricus]MDO3377827.1 glycosyltransferase family 4 protein [Geoalkalibacter halelectricus]UWZ79576.1 glycosyltransferase family 4 protein [Geoalkalibacter halelectricus]
MTHILLIGALPRSLINFRGDLLKALVDSGHKVTAMSADAPPEIVQQLAEIGVTFRPFPVQRNAMNPLCDLKTLLTLRKAYRELKPDIAFAYTIKPVIWGGFALRGNTRVRFYALVTGLGFAFQEGSLFRKLLTALVSRLYKASFARASRVIFQNPDNRDLFIEQRLVPKEKCGLVNGSGVDVDRFAFAPLPADGVVFLTIGRLLGEKGFREYAEAARIVKERYPEAVFRLVGPTDPSPDGISLEEVKGWQAAGWIEYLGESKDVRPHLRASSIFVLPSFYLEGIPRTILEALAIGRPILTTDNAGCRETVIQGENGFLVPMRDSQALAERMIWFIENRDQWQRMAERSRQMAEERFDVHKVNRELMEIMELI